MQYEETIFDDWSLIGTIGTCDYCSREISECCKHEKIAFGLVCTDCFVWWCYDKGIKCKATKNVVEF
jgi:hypothetical protein